MLRSGSAPVCLTGLRRVRFPSSAPNNCRYSLTGIEHKTFNLVDTGSSPVNGTKLCSRSLMVKHLPYTQHSRQISEQWWFESTREYHLNAWF